MSQAAGNTFLLECLKTVQPKVIVNDFRCVFHKELKFRYVQGKIIKFTEVKKKPLSVHM
jgi:hypothetical protein